MGRAGFTLLTVDVDEVKVVIEVGPAAETPMLDTKSEKLLALEEVNNCVEEVVELLENVDEVA